MDEFVLQQLKNEITVTRIANLHYFEFQEDYRTHADSHGFCELLYVDRGAIEVEADGYSGPLRAGELLIHRPNERHSLSAAKNAPDVIIIGFECDAAELAPLSKKPVPLTDELTRMLASVLGRGMDMFEPPYDVPDTRFMKKRENCAFGTEQLFRSALESFLIELTRTGGAARGGAKSGVVAVEKYISENYTAKITLDNLCFLFGTNKTTLCREFKSTFGTGVARYVNDLRIREAKALLREGGMSVTEIAARLGFDSLHYFSRLFKQYTGASPTEYAKRR